MKTYIKKWASYMGMSVESLAEASGVSQKIILKWYEDSLTPSVAQLTAISKAMNVKMDDLINVNPDDLPMEDEESNQEDKLIDFDELEKKATASPEEEDIGKRMVATIPLKEWMESLGVTIEDICEVSGIPDKVVESWINQQSNPSLLQAKVLADMFGIPVDDLMTKTPKDFYKEYLEIHMFETTKFKTAVRVQNYFRSNGIYNDCVLVRSEKYDLFIIRYEKIIPLTMWDFFKISISPTFKDRREKETLDDEKYKGMRVVKAF